MKVVLETFCHARIIPPILLTYIRLRLDLLVDSGRDSEQKKKKNALFFRVVEHSMENTFTLNALKG